MNVLVNEQLLLDAKTQLAVERMRAQVNQGAEYQQGHDAGYRAGYDNGWADCAREANERIHALQIRLAESDRLNQALRRALDERIRLHEATSNDLKNALRDLRQTAKNLTDTAERLNDAADAMRQKEEENRSLRAENATLRNSYQSVTQALNEAKRISIPKAVVDRFAAPPASRSARPRQAGPSTGMSL